MEEALRILSSPRHLLRSDELRILTRAMRSCGYIKQRRQFSNYLNYTKVIDQKYRLLLRVGYCWQRPNGSTFRSKQGIVDSNFSIMRYNNRITYSGEIKLNVKDVFTDLSVNNIDNQIEKDRAKYLNPSSSVHLSSLSPISPLRLSGNHICNDGLELIFLKYLIIKELPLILDAVYNEIEHQKQRREMQSRKDKYEYSGQ